MPPVTDITVAYLQQRERLERAALSLLGCPAAAADVAQEAWTHAAAATTPVHDPIGFLHRIARNLTLDRLRQRSRKPLELDAAPQHVADGAPGPDRIVADRQTLARVSDAIDALPSRCREAFLLARLDGLSHSEIAARMGISARTVENHVAMALLRLREVLRAGS